MEREEKSEKIIIRRIIVGPLETNCYLVSDKETKYTVIIDPGDEAEKIFNAIKEEKLKPKFILLTHEHPDHTSALKAVSEVLGIKRVVAEDGDILRLGGLEIKVIAMPGHSRESVCFVADDPAIGGAGNIFSGDTLFKQGIGRTDLEGGDFYQIQKSLKRLMEFPDDFKVFPGHGPETTIGEEKHSNSFLK